MNPPEQCAATTAAGEPCRKPALPDSATCAQHAPDANRGGRPPAFRPDVVHRVLQVLTAGGHLATAADAAGISAKTLSNWLGRGRNSDAPEDEGYRAFAAQVDQARGEAETRNIAIVAQAAQGDWKAAAWMLERGWPERWSRPSQRAGFDTPAAPDPLDPFAEVDELAARRRVRP